MLSLALIDKNKLSIGACGAIPPLVALLINGSNRAWLRSKLAETRSWRKEESQPWWRLLRIVPIMGRFAVLTLLQLCIHSVRNRGIPPLVAFSQNGTAKAKHKAETLLGYLRELRQEASTSTS
nr:U-box domain-containing protein 4 [Ipomoea batatas]